MEDPGGCTSGAEEEISFDETVEVVVSSAEPGAVREVLAALYRGGAEPGAGDTPRTFPSAVP